MKNPIHTQMISIYHEWYLKEKGFSFVWDAKQNKQIDYIYDKLVKACTSTSLSNLTSTSLSNLTSTSRSNHSDDIISGLFEKLLSNLQKADKWVYENVSPALISAKFNEVTAKIRALGTAKNGSYNDMKKDLIRNMFGNENR